MIKNVLKFFKNIYNFRYELWNFREFDYNYNLEIFKKSLQLTYNFINKYGMEIDETKIPKLRILKEVIRRIDYDLNSKYFNEIKLLGLKEPKMNIISNNDMFSEIKFEKDIDNYYDKCKELEERNWNNIWELINNNMKYWWD